MIAMISPIFIFLACAAALPRIEPGARLDMATSYAEERTAFLLFFLAYQGGNWILTLSGLAGTQLPLVLPLAGTPLPLVLAVRAIASAALVIALLARSRRWDWFAVAVIGATLVIRLVTQLAR